MPEEKPWRMLLKGSFQGGWLLCDQEEKDRIFSYWVETQKKWQTHGARFVCSLDSELLNVGEAINGSWNFYEVWEIPDPAAVKQLLDYFRYPKDGGPRLDRYFRFEATIGHPIGSVERAMKKPG